MPRFDTRKQRIQRIPRLFWRQHLQTAAASCWHEMIKAHALDFILLDEGRSAAAVRPFGTRIKVLHIAGFSSYIRRFKSLYSCRFPRVSLVLIWMLISAA